MPRRQQEKPAANGEQVARALLEPAFGRALRVTTVHCKPVGQNFVLRPGSRDFEAKLPTQELTRQAETSSAWSRVSSAIFQRSAPLGSSLLLGSRPHHRLSRGSRHQTLHEWRESSSLGKRCLEPILAGDGSRNRNHPRSLWGFFGVSSVSSGYKKAAAVWEQKGAKRSNGKRVFTIKGAERSKKERGRKACASGCSFLLPLAPWAMPAPTRGGPTNCPIPTTPDLTPRPCS